jgi:alpha-amylase
VENTDLGYHGYWAKNIYRVNPHFGSEADLRRLVLEAHKRGVKVMVDVVFNHVGYVEGGNDFSEIVPFNSEKKHYHVACEINEKDWLEDNREKIERCRLCGLPDLNTESEEVKAILFKWIGDSVIAKYGFDAIRIDTVRHIGIRFWEELSHYLSDVPVFHLGEVMVREPSRVAEY